MPVIGPCKMSLFDCIFEDIEYLIYLERCSHKLGCISKQPTVTTNENDKTVH
jgi:hypothetical protein